MSAALPLIHVMVALISDRRGRFLIGQRRPGQHMAGAWEFPGGKKRPDETPRAALARELDEELGIALGAAEPLLEIVHEYPDDLRVRLDVWRVHDYAGEPQALEGQSLKWVTVAQMHTVGLLEADRPIVAALERLAGVG